MATDLGEIERRRADYYRRRHGNVIDPFRVLSKLLEEAGELSQAIRKQRFDEARLELADVVLCTLDLARYLDTTLAEQVEMKLGIVEKRLTKQEKAK